MKFLVSAVCSLLLICVLMQGSVLAVGYERLEIKRLPSGRIVSNVPPKKTMMTAMKEATFVERVPVILDTVKFTVKDILAQFGISGPHSN